MLTAWGDESGSIPQQDPDSYLLSAALIEDNDIPEVRKTIEGIRLRNEPSETNPRFIGKEGDPVD
ncbi:hypothetical protein [Gordonia alkanivorans]|uniref:DUF3800 domain-containing protein n=1 Tax=Gordonia alkanivorans NBRC 16433 TaxID=1027371 RepID=F9VXM6_9ACTN|nr:hypothetical protein [Gordonia alkanivorans]GAA13365.1 hypothetical protein GOALK_072_01680 [Gordonia alkanivorans NBRC 16433]